MTITNGYATLVEFRERYSIPDASEDARIESIIQAASRAIDKDTRRQFFQTSSATRYFTPHRADLLFIKDCLSITSLELDRDNDGTFEESWTSSDYYTAPYSSIPFQYIETLLAADSAYLNPFLDSSDTVGTFLPLLRKSVKIVGNWGWSTAPDQITEACYVQAYRMYKRIDSPFGVMGSPEFGMIRIPALDPDVKHLIAPYILKDFRL